MLAWKSMCHKCLLTLFFGKHEVFLAFITTTLSKNDNKKVEKNNIFAKSYLFVLPEQIFFSQMKLVRTTPIISNFPKTSYLRINWCKMLVICTRMYVSLENLSFAWVKTLRESKCPEKWGNLSFFHFSQKWKKAFPFQPYTIIQYYADIMYVCHSVTLVRPTAFALTYCYNYINRNLTVVEYLWHWIVVGLREVWGSRSRKGAHNFFF
jgi:hypothetical protein